MAACQHCGTAVAFPYTCNHCGNPHCPDCRLPESHDCRGLYVDDMRSRTTARAKHFRHRQSSGSVRWLFVLFLAVAAIGVGGAMLGTPDVGAAGTPNETATPTDAPPTVTQTPTATATPTPELDLQAVATAIHEEVNRVRQEHNRIGLAHEGRLQTAARRHSEVMAEEGYIFHNGPDGNLEERIERAGYDCRVSLGDGRYATGGENVAQTWYRVPIEGGDYYDTPEELARGLVEMWMNSPDHRENLLENHWRRHGAAVAVVEEPEGMAVYATQIFC